MPDKIQVLLKISAALITLLKSTFSVHGFSCLKKKKKCMRNCSIAQRHKNHYELCLKLCGLYLTTGTHGHALLDATLIKLLEG